LQKQITQDTEEKNKGLAIQEDGLCFLLSQLRNCYSFIDDILQRGVNKDVLAMKKSMLKRRDKLKEMKTHNELYSAVQQQAPIILKGVDKAVHLISKLGSFCEAQKCFVSDISEEVFVGKETAFNIFLKDDYGYHVHHSKELDVLVQYYNKGRITEAVAIREVSAASNHKAFYVPKFPGSHTLSIEVGGIAIPGSPFKVTATLRDYRKIGVDNCQLITHYGGKEFQEPCDIAVTTNDDIVVIDHKTKEVVILDKDLNLIRTFDSELSHPVCVALGHNVIAVSDRCENVVKKFSLGGDFLSKFGSGGIGDGQFVYPVGLTFNSKNLLYVVDRYNYRVQVFDSNNNFLLKFGHKGSNSGQFQNPCCIAIDSINQVYVTDCCDGCRRGIVVFSEDGHFINKINCYKPLTICLTSDDYIIADEDGHCISVFSPTHQLVTKFGTQGSQTGQFNCIYGIAVNSTGKILIAENGNHRLQVIAT